MKVLPQSDSQNVNQQKILELQKIINSKDQYKRTSPDNQQEKKQLYSQLGQKIDLINLQKQKEQKFDIKENRKKSSIDFKNLSHYEIMAHIEKAAFKQKLEKSKKSEATRSSLQSSQIDKYKYSQSFCVTPKRKNNQQSENKNKVESNKNSNDQLNSSQIFLGPFEFMQYSNEKNSIQQFQTKRGFVNMDLSNNSGSQIEIGGNSISFNEYVLQKYGFNNTNQENKQFLYKTQRDNKGTNTFIMSQISQNLNRVMNQHKKPQIEIPKRRSSHLSIQIKGQKSRIYNNSKAQTNQEQLQQQINQYFEQFQEKEQMSRNQEILNHEYNNQNGDDDNKIDQILIKVSDVSNNIQSQDMKTTKMESATFSQQQQSQCRQIFSQQQIQRNIFKQTSQINRNTGFSIAESGNCGIPQVIQSFQDFQKIPIKEYTEQNSDEITQIQQNIHSKLSNENIFEIENVIVSDQQLANIKFQDVKSNSNQEDKNSQMQKKVIKNYQKSQKSNSIQLQEQIKKSLNVFQEKKLSQEKSYEEEIFKQEKSTDRKNKKEIVLLKQKQYLPFQDDNNTVYKRNENNNTLFKSFVKECDQKMHENKAKSSQNFKKQKQLNQLKVQKNDIHHKNSENQIKIVRLSNLDEKQFDIQNSLTNKNQEIQIQSQLTQKMGLKSKQSGYLNSQKLNKLKQHQNNIKSHQYQMKQIQDFQTNKIIKHQSSYKNKDLEDNLINKKDVEIVQELITNKSDLKQNKKLNDDQYSFQQIQNKNEKMVSENKISGNSSHYLNFQDKISNRFSGTKLIYRVSSNKIHEVGRYERDIKRPESVQQINSKNINYVYSYIDFKNASQSSMMFNNENYFNDFNLKKFSETPKDLQIQKMKILQPMLSQLKQLQTQNQPIKVELQETKALVNQDESDYFDTKYKKLKKEQSLKKDDSFKLKIPTTNQYTLNEQQQDDALQHQSPSSQTVIEQLSISSSQSNKISASIIKNATKIKKQDQIIMPAEKTLQNEEIVSLKTSIIHKTILDDVKNQQWIEFEKRNKELLQRRNDGIYNERQKNKQPVDQNIMFTQLQKLGNISKACKIQDSILNKKLFENQNYFLTEQLSLNTDKNKYDKIQKIDNLTKQKSQNQQLKNSLLLEQIKTKQDEIVFQRLNPHLLPQNAKLQIEDQSLFNLLQKNGGVPLSNEQLHDIFIKKFGKVLKNEQKYKNRQIAKQYHSMDQFEKKSFNEVQKLKQENKIEFLQDNLMQYIKQNKDEEQLKQFYTQIMYIFSQKHQSQNENIIFSRNSSNKIISQNQSQSSLQTLKNQINSFSNSQKIESRNYSKQSSHQKPNQNIRKSQFQQLNVDDFLKMKEEEKLQQIREKEEDRIFELYSQQKQGTKYFLTRQEREAILAQFGFIKNLEEMQIQNSKNYSKEIKKKEAMKKKQNDLRWLQQNEEKQLKIEIYNKFKYKKELTHKEVQFIATNPSNIDTQSLNQNQKKSNSIIDLIDIEEAMNPSVPDDLYFQNYIQNQKSLYKKEDPVQLVKSLHSSRLSEYSSVIQSSQQQVNQKKESQIYNHKFSQLNMQHDEDYIFNPINNIDEFKIKNQNFNVFQNQQQQSETHKNKFSQNLNQLKNIQKQKVINKLCQNNEKKENLMKKRSSIQDRTNEKINYIEIARQCSVELKRNSFVKVNQVLQIDKAQELKYNSQELILENIKKIQEYLQKNGKSQKQDVLLDSIIEEQKLDKEIYEDCLQNSQYIQKNAKHLTKVLRELEMISMQELNII